MKSFEDLEKESFEKLCISPERFKLLLEIGNEFATIYNNSLDAVQLDNTYLTVIDIPHLVEKLNQFCERYTLNKIEQTYLCFTMGVTIKDVIERARNDK